MSVVSSLVSAGVSESQIFNIFETYPIGEKYLEKGSSKTRWLQRHIDKANNFVTVKSEPNDLISDDDDESSQLFPFRVMTGAAGNFANLYGSTLETPKEFLYMSYMTCLGTALSTKLS